MVFLVLVFNCQKEDEIKNSQQKVQNSIQKSFDYEVKTFDELTTFKKFNKVYNKVTDKIKENKSSSSSKTAMEDMYNFTIDSTSIVEVELENYTSYTFSIYRDEPSVDYYENLFIEIDSTDSPQASLLKYNINTYDNSVTSIEATKIIYDSSSTSGKIIYNDDVECTTISIYYITTCPCEGHWPGESCTCTQGQPTSLLLNSYSSCDFNSGGDTPEESEIGTITFTPSNQNIGSSGGQYSTYSYTVSNSNNILSQRRKSLKTAFGMNTWNWFILQDEEFKGAVFGYLESTINIDGLVSNATNYPQEELDFVLQEAIEVFMNDEDCIFLPAVPISEITANYEANLFGDEPNPQNQLDHEAIKQQYEQESESNGNLAAVNYLISVYSMEIFDNLDVIGSYSIILDPANTNEAHTDSFYDANGNFISSTITLENGLVTYSDFGYTTRAIKHELLHVLQAKYLGLNIPDPAKEFDAYYFSLFRFKKLPLYDNYTATRWARRVKLNWDLLNVSEKPERQNSYNKLKEYFPEICND